MTDAPITPPADDSNPFTSRKFLLAALFAIVGCAALFFSKMAAQEFNWLVSIILVGHNAGNILDKKFNS
jgi:hypothetical protein